LVSHLNTPDPDVRVAIVRAIGTLGQYGASALDHLCTMLADGNENTAVCQAVVETIGSIGLVGTHTLEILYDRLADDNVNIVVRVSIVEAIGRIGFIEEDVLQILVARLTDSDWRIRAAVIQAIGKLGFNAVPALDLICTRLTDKNENTVVRQAVAWAIGTLGSLGAPTLDVLSTIIADENDNPAVRQAVAWAIGTFGLYGAPALESLSASLANENEKVAVRREIAEAIGKIGIAEVYVLPYLVPLLSDSNPEVRAAVVQAIGTLEHAGVPALEALSASLANQDENLAVRQAVAEAIGKVGTADVDVLPYLVPLLSDANPEVRAAVVQAIGTLGLDGVPALFNLSTFLNDSDMNVRERVALVIGRFGRQAEHALPALVAQLNDHEEDVRVAVEWAIKSIVATGISVKPSILDRLGSPEWQVRRVAAGIVKAFGPKAAALLPQLEKQLANPDKSAIVREKVAQAIGALRIAISSPLPNLLNWLSDPEWRVREAMKRSIRELAEAGVAVVEQLSQLLVDPNVNGEMRLAVVEVIEALVSTEREVSLGLYELLPKRGELLVHFDSWHIQQAIEEAGRAPQQIRDISKSMEISHQLIDSHGIILKAEDEADIVQQFGDVDWQVRELALRKIGDQKELMESSESLLMEALADSEPIVSDSAAIALATMYPDILNEKLLKDLTKAFEGHPQGIFLPFAQRNELNLYLTLGSEAHPFLDSVVELLDAEHWSVREGAVRVLGALRHISSATMSVLMRLYKEDRSPAVRQAVEEALEAILSLDDTFDPGTNQEVE
jgi:HEAT repeat protein